MNADLMERLVEPGIGASGPEAAELIAIDAEGQLLVSTADGRRYRCAWLETAGTSGVRLARGDLVLAILPGDGHPGVVLGRIGRYRAPAPEAHVTIEATETLTLKCGASSVDLRADGKLMVRGEDVLLRARGTQRIRAGTVAIN